MTQGHSLLSEAVTVPCDIWVMFMMPELHGSDNTVTVPCDIWVMFMFF